MPVGTINRAPLLSLLPWVLPSSNELFYEIGITSLNVVSHFNNKELTCARSPMLRVYCSIKLLQLCLEMLVRKYEKWLRPFSVWHYICLLEIAKGVIRLVANKAKLFGALQRIHRSITNAPEGSNYCKPSAGSRTGVLIPAVCKAGPPERLTQANAICPLPDAPVDLLDVSADCLSLLRPPVYALCLLKARSRRRYWPLLVSFLLDLGACLLMFRRCSHRSPLASKVNGTGPIAGSGAADPHLAQLYFSNDPAIVKLKRKYFELFSYAARSPIFNDVFRDFVLKFKQHAAAVPLVGSLFATFVDHWLFMRHYHFYLA
eukprot:GGOE01046323.1.p1 GENE.GGOE01046323.1~~GGOE01046323.1.p1  ORF type:complete len:317 (+),score=57.67 GGOE01046323.1:76-1026(+)